MPDRHTLGAAFLPMAMTAGLTSAIMDTRTPQIVDAVKAADLLLGHDEWGGSWIAAHRKKQAAAAGMSGRAVHEAARLRGRRPPARGADRPARRAGVAAARRHRPRAAVASRPSGREVRVPPGVSVFDAASWNGIAIDSTCGGHGTCKKCKVQLLDGSAPVHRLDAALLHPATSSRAGWRLACLAQATQDLRSTYRR